MKPLRAAALLVAIAALAACGLKGGLDKPPPQFGEAHRKYEADQRVAAEEKAKKEKGRQTITVPTAPATGPTTATTSPLPPTATTDIGGGTNAPPAPPK